MTLLRLLALTLPLLMLTGCFEFLEEIWINQDGSGRVRIDIGVTTALFAIGGNRMKDELQAQFRAEAEEARKLAEGDPDVTKITLETREEETLLHIVYDIEVRDVTKLPAIQRRLFESNQRLETSRAESALDLDFRIEETDSGYRFVQVFGKAGADAGSLAGASNTAATIGQQMAAALFADRGMVIRLHAPEFAAHNGTLAEDAKTVEWRIPFAKLLATGGAFHEELHAEVVTGKGTIFYVAGGALALLMVLAGMTLGGKKKQL